MNAKHLVVRTLPMALLALIALTTASGFLWAETPDWQKHIDWALGNHTTDPGRTNCVAEYDATEPKCILGGGRACLMARAIDSAKANNYDYAFRLVLITQCHNAGRQQQLKAAGKQEVGNYLAVGDYLKRK